MMKIRFSLSPSLTSMRFVLAHLSMEALMAKVTMFPGKQRISATPTA